jgi:TetR/AcrR family transcriptional repressor of nem operon
VARPKEFDPALAVAYARAVFWKQGYAATTTEDLRTAMGIARQSFYDSFGGKREVFLLALEGYHDARFAESARLVAESASPLAGLQKLFTSLADETDAERARGCFGVSSISELGTSDPDVTRITDAANAKKVQLLMATVERAQKRGEVNGTLDPLRTAVQLSTTFVGMRVVAKGGASVEILRGLVASTMESLTRGAPGAKRGAKSR